MGKLVNIYNIFKVGIHLLMSRFKAGTQAAGADIYNLNMSNAILMC